MTVRAKVVVTNKDGDRPWLRGEFEFLQLPAPEDRFTIRELSGSEDDVRVRYVEHEPLRVGGPLGDVAPRVPTAIITVEWLTGRAD